MRALQAIGPPLCLIALVLLFGAPRLHSQEGPGKSTADVTISDLALHPEQFDGQLVSVKAVFAFGWEGDNFLLDPSKPIPVTMPSRSRDPAAVWFYCKPGREHEVYGPIADRRVGYGAFKGYFHWVSKTQIVNGAFDPGPLQFEATEAFILESQPHSLAEAMIMGDVDETRRILQSRENHSIYHEYRDILLFHAVEAGRLDFVQELLAGGADPKFTAPGGDTSLMRAAWKCDLEVAKTLLDHGAAVNAADIRGETALIFASQTCADGKMVQHLLNAGANPNAKTTNGTTALMAARRSPVNAEALLKAGADPTSKDQYGNTVESDSCDRGEAGFYKVCQLVREALANSAPKK